jgi:hypothetical protein
MEFQACRSIADYLLRYLARYGVIVSLFDFATDKRLDYSHLLKAAHTLERQGKIIITKNKHRQGKPLTLKASKEWMTRNQSQACSASGCASGPWWQSSLPLL